MQAQLTPFVGYINSRIRMRNRFTVYLLDGTVKLVLSQFGNVPFWECYVPTWYMSRGLRMDIVELIERAKKAAGSQLAVAEKIGRPHSRISEWKAGRRKPDAADIMLLAETAELPPLETLAEIECQLDGERASVWERALGNLRAAGVAATVLLGVGGVTLAGMTPEKAQAAEKDNNLVARPAGIEPATPAFGGQHPESSWLARVVATIRRLACLQQPLIAY